MFYLRFVKCSPVWQVFVLICSDMSCGPPGQSLPIPALEELDGLLTLHFVPAHCHSMVRGILFHNKHAIQTQSHQPEN